MFGTTETTDERAEDSAAQPMPATGLALANNWHNLFAQELERANDAIAEQGQSTDARGQLHAEHALLLQVRETFEFHLRGAIQDAVRLTAADLIFGFDTPFARAFVTNLLQMDADGNPNHLDDFWKS